MPSEAASQRLEQALPEVPGYRIQRLLRVGPRSLAYRATALENGDAVVVKLQREAFPSERDLAAETRAFDIASGMPADALVRHLSLVPCGRGLALVTEDFGGRSLDLLMQDRGALALAEGLPLAIALARALAALHAQAVVHRSLAPANIVHHAESGRVGLIDLKDCSLLDSELATDESLRAGFDLAYAAPEQTGHMNMPVDTRSDLYALGVVLFQLFCGRLPFEARTAKDLVHAHLALPAPAPSSVRPELPVVLDAILLRLLAKMPEERYASAHGLAFDLEQCREDLERGEVSDFVLGRHDNLSRFAVPDRLYGREAERRVLNEAFEATRRGRIQLRLVAGYSGIGKSALIASLSGAVAAAHGLYGVGKFEQFRRDVPYLAWVASLDRLVQVVLSEPEQELETIRSRLQTALAGNARLITDLVPAAAVLLGPQPEVPDASPAEAQARFVQTLVRFLQHLGTPERPLVVVLDDLQWADLPSLQVLEFIVQSAAPGHVLIVGAYRDNEVGAGHPLTAMLERLSAASRDVPRLALEALDEADVVALTVDTVHRDDEETRAFGRHVHRKTAGNPFFVRQFLDRLHRTGLLSFDLGTGGWRWDLVAIEAENFTDNVVDFMSARIGDVAPSVRDLLQLAACLGTGFGFQALLTLSDRPAVEVARDLEVALREGLIVPLDADYRLARIRAERAAERNEAPTIDPTYRFLHDRVQASAHDGLAADRRAAVHLRIVRQRLAQAAGEALDPARAVDVMDHLQECHALIDDPLERLTLADLCLKAARRAQASMATGPALGYLETGRALLPSDAWQACPRLTLDLHLQSAESAYVAERFDEAQTFAAEALSHADDLDERVGMHIVQIGIGVARNRFVEATDRAVTVLNSELGLRLPRRPGLPRVLLDVMRTLAALRGRDDALPLDLPEMQDPRQRAAMTILMKSATNAYWGVPNLVPIIAGNMVRLSVQHGHVGLSAYGYALSGMVLTHAVQAVGTGYRLGRLAMALLERTGERHLIGKTGLLWHGFIRHARDPLRVCAADILECYDHALDSGDVENAVYCGTVAYYADLLSGRPLDWVQARYRSYLPALLGSAQEQTILALKTWTQVAHNLSDGQALEPRARGEIIDWPAELEALLEQPGTDMTIATVAGGAGWLALLLGDWQEAEQQFALLYERQQAAMGQAFLKPCLALYGLVLLNKCREGRAGLRDRLRLSRLRLAVRRWARHNPHDYVPFETLIAAETDALAGRHSRALAGWSRCMEQARDSSIGYLEAWAAERAAAAYGADGHDSIARHLRGRARQLWQRAGIQARLTLLDGAVQAGDLPREAEGGRLDGATGELGFDAVLEAVRAVSDGVEVDTLVTEVLRISVLNAGARRGVLLIDDDGLTPFALAEVDDDGTVSARRERFALDESRLPVSLVDYVSRTRELLLVDDAGTHEWLNRDPYVRLQGCRSILGAPLLRHGDLVGIVILENDLGAGVFQPADAAVVETIAGQAAVSLENARLFEAQRRRSEAFARFVPRPFLAHLGRRRIEDVDLGDAVQQTITVMFTDLRRSTALSESMSVPDYFGLLNAFLAHVTPVVREEGGFVDGFTGDGLRAIFVDSADAGLRAAVAMQQRLRQYNRERGTPGREPLAMGIGLHTGPALLGTIGAQDRMTTTMIGVTVNTAARLEGLTKFYDAPVLISQATREALDDPGRFRLRMVGRDRVKGRSTPIDVHEVIDARPREERERLGAGAFAFGEALQAFYRREFEDAEAGFADCLAKMPEDGLARTYRDAALRYRRDGVSEDWDGVTERTEK